MRCNFSFTTPMRRAALVGLLALGAACSSSPGTSSNDSISLTLHPTSATIAPGGSVAVTGVVARNGYTDDLTISADGIPTGVTYVVTRRATNGSDSASVTLTAGASMTAGGPYTINVHAAGSGIATATASFKLTIATSGGVDTITLPSRRR